LTKYHEKPSTIISEMLKRKMCTERDIYHKYIP